MDFRKLRPTDLRDCPRLSLPQPRPPKEEATLQAKEVIWAEATARYKALHCKEDATQMVDNLTKQERRA